MSMLVFRQRTFFLFPSEAVLVAGRGTVFVRIFFKNHRFFPSRGYPTGSRQSDTFSPFSACAPHDSMDLLWRSLHPRKPVVSLASQTLGGWETFFERGVKDKNWRNTFCVT